MSENVRCTRCATELPSGSPGGLCPSCLLRLALEGTAGVEGAEAASTVAAPEGAGVAEPLGTIGPYRLLSVLGEGGMGSVYLAEQSEPIRRRVALKVIKRGMDTKDVIARFESERQALALMSHPNIARVLDAGATKDGLPYFVMEHVAGVPITEYCDRNRLDSEARIGLFGEVCEAVQHAHQKGIIHRDIKPSNVLVSEEDGEPRPRVIDFGVAKAINQRLTEKTLFTERGMIVGTPAYMSPEQSNPTALDIDTRTDIYSLGVLLYELITGVPPFDPKRLLSSGLGRDAADHPGGRAAEAIDSRLEAGGYGHGRRGEAANDAGRAGEGPSGGFGLDHAEGAGKRPGEAVPVGDGACGGHPATSGERASVGGSTQHGVPGVEVRPPEPARRRRGRRRRRCAGDRARDNGRSVRPRRGCAAARPAQSSSESNVATGMKLAQEGDHFGALPWLVRALKFGGRWQAG